MIVDDSQAYKSYPSLRHWFNKLWVAEHFGYCCGPAGIAPEKTGDYIVRPVMNLSGMSLGARKTMIESGDVTQAPPGYFWCEWFEGKQISVEYQWDHSWLPVDGWEAEIDFKNLSRFRKWSRTFVFPELNQSFDEISAAGISRINVEFVGGNPIEIHLRQSPDPRYDVFVPIWKNDENDVDKYIEMGYHYISSYEDADGFLANPRIGFVVKNHPQPKEM